ncbi:COG4648 family protein [Flocculibacter collagenilyticus]|uniref:COG4648 family protein n=1 Tax=Flocculibacter collagenilyticus TaxID=2744479 RepID=UPI001F42933F|nr:hypothetical protein [Flocculibacter collagenilyticus]
MFFGVSLGIATLLYPVMVFAGMQYFEPVYVALVMLIIVTLKLFSQKALLKKLPWLKLTSVVGIACLIFSIFEQSAKGILFYPVLINCAMLAVFGYSLIKKPTVVETLARLSEPDLDENGVKYTEKVTKVWCLFFSVNGGIAAITAMYYSLEVWTLYNGLIAYIAMGLMMGVEWIVRQVVRKRNANAASEHVIRSKQGVSETHG